MLHQDLARGRWHQMTLVEQLANIGSEVGRAWQAQEQGLESRRDNAINRALELFDLTLATPNLRASALREVARAREIFVTDFYADNCYGNSAAKWDKYFTPFVLAARRQTTKLDF
jgi:hypothetical protein